MKWDYFSRLTWAAYWHLPALDAEDVLSDYQDILRHKSCPEQELVKELGTPRQVIHQVLQPRAYHQWLVAFCVFVACLLLPAAAALWFSPLTQFFRSFLPATLLLPCAALSFVCFQQQSPKKPSFPWKMLPLFLLPALGIAAAWVTIWWAIIDIRTFFWLAESSGGRFNGHTVHLILSYAICLSTLAGMAGLAGARVCDRRWRSLYVLSLTSILLCATLVLVLSNMDIMIVPVPEGCWHIPEFRQCFYLTAVGLVGTGIALC